MMEKFFSSMTKDEKKALMNATMPRMMENCLSSMTPEERKRMFSFCHTMLGYMEERFAADNSPEGEGS